MLIKTKPEIDEKKCTGCGVCVKYCPTDTLVLSGGKAAPEGDECIGCGHCFAVCPEEAVDVPEIDEELTLTTLKQTNRRVDYGDYDAESLVNLMRSRRSCRDFSDEPVPLEVLKDLVKIGTTAPSGTNSQSWTFRIVPDRNSVKEFGKAVKDFFKRLNRLASSGAMRLLARIFLKDALGEYYRTYFDKVKQAIKEWEESGRDRLFHGAPALILVGGVKEGYSPKEDAMLATQNILLAAHAMGYGTCLIGFAVEAVKHDKKVKKLTGMPKTEELYAVVALGKCKVRFLRNPGRRTSPPGPLSMNGEGE